MGGKKGRSSGNFQQQPAPYWQGGTGAGGSGGQRGGFKTPPGASSQQGFSGAATAPLAAQGMSDMSKWRGGGGGSLGGGVGGGTTLGAALQKVRNMQSGVGRNLSQPYAAPVADRSFQDKWRGNAAPGINPNLSPAVQSLAASSGGNAAEMGRQFAAGSQSADKMGINANLSPAVRALAASSGGNAAEMGKALMGMRHGGAVRPGRLVGSRASGRRFQAGGIAEAMGGMAPGMVPPGMEEMGGMAPGMGEEFAVEEQVTDVPGVGEFGAMEEQSMEVPMPETSGEVAQQQEMLNIVLEAKAALEGNHPNPEEAIMKFLEVFGEEELESLKVAVIEEMQSGEVSDGMSDTLPANIDGQEEIAVSEGEYIVPSDAVSGLGNGDTNSGAQRLGEMVNKIRTVRGGSPVQPREMMAEEVMPI